MIRRSYGGESESRRADRQPVTAASPSPASTPMLVATSVARCQPSAARRKVSTKAERASRRNRPAMKRRIRVEENGSGR